MNDVMVIKCLELFLLCTYTSVFINFVYVCRLHQLKRKFKSIIYNRSGYEASFLIVSEQIYSQSFEKFWSGAGASHFKMLKLSWSWSHSFLKCWSRAVAGAIHF